MAYNNYKGSKYNAKHTRVERKAAILAHLKTLVDAPARVDLREGRGVGTMSLTATISNLPFPCLDAETIAFEVLNPNTAHRRDRQSPKVVELLSKLSAEAELFNYDKSEIETDYFDRAFYFHASLKHEEYEAEKLAVVNGGSQRRAAIYQTIVGTMQVYLDAMAEQNKKATVLYWGDAFRTAVDLDKAGHGDGKLAEKIAKMQSELKKSEDWDQAAANAAQAAHVASKMAAKAEKRAGRKALAEMKASTRNADPVVITVEAGKATAKIRRLTVSEKFTPPAPAPVEPKRVFSAEEIAAFRTLGIGPDGESPLHTPVAVEKTAHIREPRQPPTAT